MKSNILGILLLFCFVAPVATTYAILQYQKKQIKREVKWRMIAGIDKNDLVLIKLTKEEQDRELVWEHAKEFEYKGEMYDIASTQIKGDTSYFYCWWDYEETQLNKQLKTLVDTAFGKNPTKQEKQDKLQSFFKSLYYSKTTIELMKQTADINNYNKFNSEFYPFLFDSPPVPPPEIS